MKKLKYIIPALGVITLILFVTFSITSPNAVLFHPKGIMALSERNIFITAVLIMSIIAVPVYILTLFIAFRYRESNKKAEYKPDLKYGNLFVSLWWVIPTILILVLAVMNWKATHKLDPFNALDSDKAPITIQVVSLRWKWLFIYPEQNIATVNFVEFPAKTPIIFELTSDAPMNSFWIPSLSGQIYTMSGMSTKIHMMANMSGDFAGSAAEISGKGFSGMRFTARSVSENEFKTWVSKVLSSPKNLNLDEYEKLSAPSEDNPVVLYSTVEPNLYNKIIEKFSAPAKNNTSMQGMEQK